MTETRARFAWLLVAAAFSTLVVTSSFVPVAAAQRFVPVVDKQPIPREGFKTWSLFLVTNQDWLVPVNASRLQELYDRSQAFGRTIGADHAAVWFWKYAWAAARA